MEWPSGGPDKWITEWQKLMSHCERWCEPLYELWASDFNLVWGEVPGTQRLCDRLIEAVNKDDKKDWNIFRASMELKQAWDQKSIRNGMRIAGKGRTTRAVFTTDVRFDGIGAHEEPIEEVAQQSTQGRTGSRKRTATDNFQRQNNKKRQHHPYRNQRLSLICWGCNGQHGYFHCPLILGSNRRKIEITKENRQTFDRKMKDPTFVGKVKKIREADQIAQELTGNTEVC